MSNVFNLADIFNVMAFLSALPFLIFFAKNLIEEPKHASLPAPAELSRGVASDHRSGGATNDEELPPPYSPGDFGRRFFRTRQPSMDTLINALLRQGERSARHQSRERVPRSGAMPSLPAFRNRVGGNLQTRRMNRGIGSPARLPVLTLPTRA